MNHLKDLRQVRDTTGHHLRLGVLETVEAIQINPTKIVVLINRVGAKETRYGFEVFRRGATLHTFVLREGKWTVVPSITQWWSSAELFTSAPVRERDTEWEDMCHRPGTSRAPLDNTSRRMQGYDY